MSVDRTLISPIAEFLAPRTELRPHWDDVHGLEQAYKAAQLSDDPSTQVGAWINGIQGYNRQVDYDPPSTDKNWSRVHAETDALLNCDFPSGGTLYAPWACCTNCAVDILAADVHMVVIHYDRMIRTPRKWEPEVLSGLRMLIRNGVLVRCVQWKFGVTIRIDGQEVEV